MRRTVSIGGAGLLALALLAPSDAATTATVTGTVTLTARRGTPLRAAAYGRRGVAPKASAVVPETHKVVVYLTGIKPATPPPPMHAAIVQKGEQFVPPVTVVTTGSTVEFPNADPYFHNVFSLSRAATFDLGRFPAGESREHRFDRPGIVKVFCHIHAQMSALVMVLDHPWFAIPNDEGAYTLPAVPPGTYTLVAWHERIGEQRTQIRVQPGEGARVHFTLPVLEHTP